MKRKAQIGEFTVETWYDRQSRNWITQLKDQNNNEIESAYSGSKDGARFDFKQLVDKATKRNF